MKEIELSPYSAADSSTNAGSHQFPIPLLGSTPTLLVSVPTNTFCAYQATLGNPEENIYHPYLSKLDWDLANWANRRNPGSNALLELLAIPGVVEKLDLSYSSSCEMNKIVNESLPDPATFLCEEVSVKGAKSDVYLPPEKHYKDKTMSKRVYHDTNTATFWWNAQSPVLNLKSSCFELLHSCLREMRDGSGGVDFAQKNIRFMKSREQAAEAALVRLPSRLTQRPTSGDSIGRGAMSTREAARSTR
ncbi:hypothetical protein BDV98DRAFT_587226 [Pterulicium gracile]|uniref:Uncharacterized protein n=1 Tax=Pterulicium gracile TaxID=1884261 RepID=A0A5C3Q0C7_9AGAR|nr:hypothetical protein BDV98DRAFT_587226 [Pterula gracilis]